MDIDVLRGSPYFAGLDGETLASVARAIVVRHYGPGERIFNEGEGDGSAALHFVAEGTVRIYKFSLEGREQTLRLMRPGDTFADVPAFDGGPYPASADALERSTVLMIPRTVLLQLLRDHPEMTLGILQVMASRLRHMTALVEDLSLRRVMARVARLLRDHEQDVHLTQTQMAAMVGTAREMVNRSLHALADDGAIELRGNAIVVLDRQKLDAVVEAG